MIKLAKKSDTSFMNEYCGWFFWVGLALVIIGALAVSAAAWTTLLTVTVLGMFIAVGSTFMILDTLTFWWGRGTPFFLHLLIGLLYLFAGVSLIRHPVVGSMSITLILGIVYVVIGMFKMTYVLSTRLYGWQWGFFNALLSLFIGMLILMSWPASSLFILGMFVGIDLIFVGWSYIIMSQTVKKNA